MKRVKFFLGAAVAACMLLASCGKSGNGVEYIPFRTTDDGYWGMIAPDGTVLFEDEFEEEITVARDGCFFAKNEDGLWDLYTATAKPEKIGNEDGYVYATTFQDGVALVTPKDGKKSIINNKGKVLKELDTIDGVAVDILCRFNEGYAVFTVRHEDRFGVIDTKGNVVIAPDYLILTNCSDGKFLGIHSKYEEEDEFENVMVSILATNGKELATLSAAKYDFEEMFDYYPDGNIRMLSSGASAHFGFHDGLLAVASSVDGEYVCGIVNAKGEEVIKPSHKTPYICHIKGDKFVFMTSEKNLGLMNIKGETLLRAKYDKLSFDMPGLLWSQRQDKKTLECIDEDGVRISDEVVGVNALFSDVDGEHCFVEETDDVISIINTKGEVIKGIPDIKYILNRQKWEGDSYIMSDFVDYDKIMAVLDIKENGCTGVFMNASIDELLKKYAAEYKMDNQELMKKFAYNRNLDFLLDIPIDMPMKLSFVTVHFFDTPVRRTSGYGDNATYALKENVGIEKISVKVGIDSFRMCEDKMDKLFKMVCEKVKSLGGFVMEEDMTSNSKKLIVNVQGYQITATLPRYDKMSIVWQWGDMDFMTDEDLAQQEKEMREMGL